MKNLIGIIAGEPNSINSEIISKIWKRKSDYKNLNIFIIGSYRLIKDQLRILKIKIKLKKITQIQNHNFKKELLILDVPLKFKKPFSVNGKRKVNYMLNSLNLAIKMAHRKKNFGFYKLPHK